MKLPVDHSKEKIRVKTLKEYSILDTLPEEDYDNLTAIASEICGTPISLVSLLDDKRQWFKSYHGLKVSETAKELAFCAHAINDPSDVFIVEDARKDDRFFDNPLVTDQPFVIFYAGVPLMSEEGLPMGTLCVIDNEPKKLSETQITGLNALAKQVMSCMELRRKTIQLKKSLSLLEVKNTELRNFATIAAHDIKAPLNSISTLTDVFNKYYSEGVTEEGQELLRMVNKSSERLRMLIDGVLQYSQSDKSLFGSSENIEVIPFVSELEEFYKSTNDIEFELESSVTSIDVNKSALNQILMNLVSNAIRYNDKDVVKIRIELASTDKHYEFKVTDNGVGIDESNINKVFQLFETSGKKDRFGTKGTGIGLSTVHKVVEKLGGTITVQSKLGQGTTFTFSVQKQ